MKQIFLITIATVLLLGCAPDIKNSSNGNDSNIPAPKVYSGNSKLDVTKLKKPEELTGYIPDEMLEKEGGKYVRKELMTYGEFLNLGLGTPIRYDIDPNRMVWVFTSVFSKVHVIEEVPIDKPIVTAVYDAETSDLISLSVKTQDPRGMEPLKAKHHP